jgi:hypothetical protein
VRSFDPSAGTTHLQLWSHHHVATHEQQQHQREHVVAFPHVVVVRGARQQPHRRVGLPQRGQRSRRVVQGAAGRRCRRVDDERERQRGCAGAVVVAEQRQERRRRVGEHAWRRHDVAREWCGGQVGVGLAQLGERAQRLARIVGGVVAGHREPRRRVAQRRHECRRCGGQQHAERVVARRLVGAQRERQWQ